jgi:hypothetical protein
MRDEIQKEDSRRDGGPGSRDDKLARRGLDLLEQDEEEEEGEGEGEGECEESGDVSVEGDSLDVGKESIHV